MRRFVDQLILACAAAGCGVVLWLALFPSFYYMTWLSAGLLLWGWVGLAILVRTVVLAGLARRDPDAPPAAAGVEFTLVMLVVTSVLVGLKVPLRASFLLARAGLEEALAEHRDDLSQVRHASHDYGLYQIGRAERRCHVEDRVYFLFRNDGEAAIIHSESGIEDLCYNSGAKGHLAGDWYWMKED